MRKQFIISFLLIALISTALSVFGSYLFIKQSELNYSNQAATIQAQNLAKIVTNLELSIKNSAACKNLLMSTSIACRAHLLALLKDLNGADTSLLLFSPDGSLILGKLPNNINLSQAQINLILNKKPVSFSSSNLSIALVPLANFLYPKGAYAQYIPVIIATQKDLAPALDLSFLFAIFLLASAVAILLSLYLVQKINKGLSQAMKITKEIASSNLEARIPLQKGGWKEFNLLFEAINNMAQSLKNLNEAERNFMSYVSHDLRTPLTSIIGYAEALTDGLIDPKQGIQVILRESQKLQRQIQDLMDLSKIESGQFGYGFKRTNLNKLLSSLKESFLPQAFAKNINFEFRSTIEPEVQVITDPDRLSQAISNLLSNALDFARSNISLTVSKSQARSIEILVKDDGPGIAPDDIPKVFERYFTRKNNSNNRGTGLGLAITKEICEKLGIAVEVLSNANYGAVFKLELPYLNQAIKSGS